MHSSVAAACHHRPPARVADEQQAAGDNGGDHCELGSEGPCDKFVSGAAQGGLVPVSYTHLCV